MALSLFIKQLLETDSIFGGEAKKLSGINDAAIQARYDGVDIQLLNNVNDFAIRINNNANPITVIPDWLIFGKYISVSIPTISQDTNTIPVFDMRRFRVESTAPVPGGYIINLIRNARGSATFPETFALTGHQITVDGRIFAIIGDTQIAREADNGSTMFNVNSSRTTGLEDGSGVAQKYAAHYHSGENAIDFEIVSHEHNEFGSTLTGINVVRNDASLTFGFDEASALTAYTTGIEFTGMVPDIGIRITPQPGFRPLEAYYSPGSDPDFTIFGSIGNNAVVPDNKASGIKLKRHSPLADNPSINYEFISFLMNGRAYTDIVFSRTDGQPNTSTIWPAGSGGASSTLSINNSSENYGVVVSSVETDTLIFFGGSVNSALNNNSQFTANYTSSWNSTTLTLTIEARADGPQFNSVTDWAFGPWTTRIGSNSVTPVVAPLSWPVSGGEDGGVSTTTRLITVPNPNRVPRAYYMRVMADAINAVVGENGNELPGEYSARMSYNPPVLPTSSPIQPSPVILRFDNSNTTSAEFTIQIGRFNEIFNQNFRRVTLPDPLPRFDFRTDQQMIDTLNFEFNMISNVNYRLEAFIESPGSVAVRERAATRGRLDQPVGTITSTPLELPITENFAAFIEITTPSMISDTAALPLATTLDSGPGPTVYQKLFEARLRGRGADLFPTFIDDLTLLEILIRENYLEIRYDPAAKKLILTDSLLAENLSVQFIEPSGLGNQPVWRDANAAAITPNPFTLNGVSAVTYMPSGPNTVFDNRGNALFHFSG